MGDIYSFSPLWGEWEIKELIGKGTFGAVYKAEKKEYGQIYTAAVKHLSIPGETVSPAELISEGVVKDKESLSKYYDDLRDKMINEVRFSYALQGNTNIVSYEDHCIIPKQNEPGYDIFIRMEYLTALTQYLMKNTLTENDVIHIGIDICSALEILAKHGMIHRDIKPANIFVSDMGSYKLGDFGESKILSAATSGMSVRGTYSYMSPEISAGKKANITADIYSLGIVMYRLLNGNRSPFIPEYVKTVTEQLQEAANVRRFEGEKIPFPQNCKDNNLIGIVLKACEFRPQDRWQTPKEMRKALEELLESRTKISKNAPDSTVPEQSAKSRIDQKDHSDIAVSDRSADPENKKKQKKNGLFKKDSSNISKNNEHSAITSSIEYRDVMSEIMGSDNPAEEKRTEEIKVKKQSVFRASDGSRSEEDEKWFDEWIADSPKKALTAEEILGNTRKLSQRRERTYDTREKRDKIKKIKLFFRWGIIVAFLAISLIYLISTMNTTPNEV